MTDNRPTQEQMKKWKELAQQPCGFTDLTQDKEAQGAIAALLREVERLTKERDEALDILWRDIDDLRDPKLGLVQVATKIANGIYWRKAKTEAARKEVGRE